MDQKLKETLIKAASNARHKARVYTGFHVGAALLTKTGEIFTGCNVELHTTLSSICAERTAIVKAVSEGYTEFEAIAVVSDSPKAISPCSFCRQYLIDFDPDILVIMSNEEKTDVVEMTVRELVPMAFVGSGRKQKS